MLASAVNHIAYSHVQRYKYYKNVGHTSIEQFLGGIFLGIPLIFIPFVYREKDQSFMNYNRVKKSVILSRILNFALFLSVIALGIDFIF